MMLRNSYEFVNLLPNYFDIFNLLDFYLNVECTRMEYVHKDVHLAQFEWYGARCKTVRLLQLAD